MSPQTVQAWVEWLEQQPRATQGLQELRAYCGLASNSTPCGSALSWQERAEIADALAERVRMLASGAPDRETAILLRTCAVRLKTSGRYARSQAPATGVSALGSIFVNAQTTSPKQSEVGKGYSTQAVQRCRNCGAPQERAQDFVCAYCRQSML